MIFVKWLGNKSAFWINFNSFTVLFCIGLSQSGFLEQCQRGAWKKASLSYFLLYLECFYCFTTNYNSCCKITKFPSIHCLPRIVTWIVLDFSNAFLTSIQITFLLFSCILLRQWIIVINFLVKLFAFLGRERGEKTIYLDMLGRFPLCLR